MIIVVVQVSMGQIAIMERLGVICSFCTQKLFHCDEAGVLNDHPILPFDRICLKPAICTDSPHSLRQGISRCSYNGIVLRKIDRPGIWSGKPAGEEFIERMPLLRILIPSLV